MITLPKIPKRSSDISVTLSEVTTYVNDLQRYTLLRDKCTTAKERAEYDYNIECMQRVMRFLNESLEDQLMKGSSHE